MAAPFADAAPAPPQSPGPVFHGRCEPDSGGLRSGLEPSSRWNEQSAFLRRCAQLFGPNRQRDGKIPRKFFRHRSGREKLAQHVEDNRPRYDRCDRVTKNIAQNRDHRASAKLAADKTIRMMTMIANTVSIVDVW